MGYVSVKSWLLIVCQAVIYAIMTSTCNKNLSLNYTIGIKLSIFYVTMSFEAMKNNFSFLLCIFECTFVFWLPNLGKFDSFHALLATNGELMAQ